MAPLESQGGTRDMDAVASPGTFQQYWYLDKNGKTLVIGSHKISKQNHWFTINPSSSFLYGVGSLSWLLQTKLRKSANCISSVPGATMYCKPKTKDNAKALTTPPKVLMLSWAVPGRTRSLGWVNLVPSGHSYAKVGKFMVV